MVVCIELYPQYVTSAGVAMYCLQSVCCHDLTLKDVGAGCVAAVGVCSRPARIPRSVAGACVPSRQWDADALAPDSSSLHVCIDRPMSDHVMCLCMHVLLINQRSTCLMCIQGKSLADFANDVLLTGCDQGMAYRQGGF